MTSANQVLLALALAMITRFAVAADQDASLRTCGAQCPEFVMIPAGTFQMGSPKDEAGRDHNEGPVHAVHVDAFYLAKTDITVAQFLQFVKATKYRTDAERNVFREGCREWQAPAEDWPDGE